MGFGVGNNVLDIGLARTGKTATGIEAVGAAPMDVTIRGSSDCE